MGWCKYACIVVTGKYDYTLYSVHCTRHRGAIIRSHLCTITTGGTKDRLRTGYSFMIMKQVPHNQYQGIIIKERRTEELLNRL